MSSRDEKTKAAERRANDREVPGNRAEERRRYAPPRIVKKRPVSRSTLFTGSGPDGGGVVGNG